MSEYWTAAAIGAGSGGLLLLLLSRLPMRQFAMQSFFAFAIMLWIYVGARLVSGSIEVILYETLFAIIAGGIAQLAMAKWPPSIGVAILLHGGYDAFFGHHAGVAEWYPPLCAGFDLVFGLGVFLLLRRAGKPRTA